MSETMGLALVAGMVVVILLQVAVLNEGVTPQQLMLKDFREDRIVERHLPPAGAGREA